MARLQTFQFSSYEWDEEKWNSVIDIHGIDFEDIAAGFFDSPVIVRGPIVKGDDRYCAVGVHEGREIVVVFTPRKDVCRLISARRARRDEIKAYRQMAAKAGG